MIAEKILGNVMEKNMDVPVDYVKIEWFETQHKRLRKTTEGGREIGICVDKKLSDGDILYLDDKICIAVQLEKM